VRPPIAAAALLLLACAAPHPESATVKSGPRTFEDDLALLQSHAPVIVLESPGGGRVAVSARWQGRVMTSAVEPHGASLGFVNRAFIESGREGTAFDNYGGEDRFWLGPEGGQYGLYFAPGADFTMSAWQVPHAMQEGQWEVVSRDASHVTFARTMHLSNWSRAEFDVAVERTVRVLSGDETRARFGDAPPAGTKWVAFETVNRITNAGTRAWTRDTGLLSVWILGMYAPSPDAHVLVPFDPAGAGPVVHDDYFGKVPPERLVVHEREGWLSFVADGELRSKIGLSPSRARDVIGSFSPGSGLLTLVRTVRPASAPDGYVNSLWAQQSDPYGGDVINSYNDGPTAPGKPSLGGFYEIETSSPAAALGPGASLEHVHATLHAVGTATSLDGFARKVLGVSSGQGLELGAGAGGGGALDGDALGAGEAPPPAAGAVSSVGAAGSPPRSE
jgi:hypothetical protein